jgi:multiple sugar transport system substrate-binding protein
MARPASLRTRREFLRTASLAAGASATGLAFAAPAVAQRPKLVYWCYQFLKASDDARVSFAQEWAKTNNVDLQLTLVPWKEFLPKITAAIEAKTPPDIVESGAVELRGRGQLLDVTDVYRKLEKTYGGWVGNAPKFMLEPDGRVHHILYGFQGFMLVGRDDLLREAGFKQPPVTWVDLLDQAKKTQKVPRVFGLGIPVSNQTDSGVWEDVMKSYGARLADEAGKRVVLGDYKKAVWEFLDYFTEVWKSGVLPPGVTTWDNTMNNSTYQAGKAVFILNPVTVSLWLEANNPELLAKTGHYIYPRGPKGQIHPVNFGSRSILKYTKVPELAKQFLWDSMEPGKMDREHSVSQWGPVLQAYLSFDVWKKKPFMKGLVDMSLRGEPEGFPDVFNDAWREQYTNTTTSRMLQRIVVDNWTRDKAFAEMLDVLTKIYGKYV